MRFDVVLSLSLAISLYNDDLKYGQGEDFYWFAWLVRDNS